MKLTTQKSFLGLLLVGFMAFNFVACSDDDDISDPTPPPNNSETASLNVQSQVISQNMVVIGKVDVPKDGWIVIHADAGSGPQLPDIISEPVYIEAGMSTDVKVPFKGSAELNDGDQVWVMLHKDNGETGTYEFDGSGNGLDLPYTKNEMPVMKEITIESPQIMAAEATYNPATNTVTIPSITTAAEDNWIVIHDQNSEGGIILTDIIGKKALGEGTFTDVKVQLESGVNIDTGQLLFPMMHLDTPGTDSQYDFVAADYPNTQDKPEIFGNMDFPGNVIFTSFTVEVGGL